MHKLNDNQVNFDIDQGLKREFAAIARKKGLSMTDMLTDYIKSYVKSSKSGKSPNRGTARHAQPVAAAVAENNG